jgi:elongation factor G
MDRSRIRNVAIIGPHGVGKTTLAESLLYDMAVLPARGRIDAGTTALDFDPEEVRLGMSLGTAIAAGDWKGTTVNLVDTPGSADFRADALIALSVADAAVLVIGAAKGIDPTARRLFEAARARRLPVIVFVNGVEQDNALDYGQLLRELHDQLDPHAIPLEYPVGQGHDFKGDVDLVGMRTWYFAPETGEVTEVAEAPSELADPVRRYHTELVEAVAELHDDLLERYLGGEEPGSVDLTRHLRADMREGRLFPVLCGSAAANLGVRPLLDWMVDLFPSPVDHALPDLVDPESGQTMPVAADAPAAIAVFKTFVDPYLGKISLFRVLSGAVGAETALRQPRLGGIERLGRLVKLVGKKAVPVERLEAGDFGAVAKLADVETGDTLLLDHHPQPRMRFPFPSVPQPIWSTAIAPTNKNDEAKLAISLAKLKEEDPTLGLAIEPKTHRTLVMAQGPLHLDAVLAKLQNRYHLAITRSEPQIPYRETISGKASGQGKHKKQTGGRGQYGDVWLTIEPLPRGAGFRFVDAVVGGAVPRPFIPAVEKGVRETLDLGLLAGFPIVDVQVTLTDGSAHSVDSSEMAFKTAAHMAMAKVFEAAHPLLLEPIMDLILSVPVEATGDVMAELNTRRAHVEAIEGATIRATLPLAELQGLLGALQSTTRGQGALEATFARYQEVPAHLMSKLLAELKAEAMATPH